MINSKLGRPANPDSFVARIQYKDTIAKKAELYAQAEELGIEPAVYLRILTKKFKLTADDVKEQA